MWCVACRKCLASSSNGKHKPPTASVGSLAAAAAAATTSANKCSDHVHLSADQSARRAARLSSQESELHPSHHVSGAAQQSVLGVSQSSVGCVGRFCRRQWSTTTTAAAARVLQASSNLHQVLF